MNFSSPRPIADESKTAYPERLLVYHAGTGKTVFLGCLKVTTIFIFFFFSLIVAPAHWQSADEPAWVAPLGRFPCTQLAALVDTNIHPLQPVLLSGAVPMMFVAYTTRPFASYVHLRLPAYARYSREYLHRYAAKLPKTAAMDITTISFFGRPRVNKVVVGDLYPAKSTFGIANFARDTMAIDAKRPWWLGKSVSAFSLSAEEGNSREKGLWTNIVKSISSTSR